MPVVVGKSAKSRALKTMMDQLPAAYYHNQSAWFTQDIVTDWFHKVFNPAVQDYQSTFYRVAKKDVKTVLLDNVPAHPSSRKLSSKGWED